MSGSCQLCANVLGSKFPSYTPGADADGDIDALSLWAGQSVVLVHKVQPAAQIVREIVTEAQAILDGLAQRRLKLLDGEACAVASRGQAQSLRPTPWHRVAYLRACTSSWDVGRWHPFTFLGWSATLASAGACSELMREASSPELVRTLGG